MVVGLGWERVENGIVGPTLWRKEEAEEEEVKGETEERERE